MKILKFFINQLPMCIADQILNYILTTNNKFFLCFYSTFTYIFVNIFCVNKFNIGLYERKPLYT